MRWVKGRRASIHSEYTALPRSPHVHQPWSILNPELLWFLWRLHYRDTVDWIIGFPSPPALSQEVEGRVGVLGLKVPTSLTPLAKSPLVEVLSGSHLINITKDFFSILPIGNSKGFRSSVPVMGMNTKHSWPFSNRGSVSPLIFRFFPISTVQYCRCIFFFLLIFLTFLFSCLLYRRVIIHNTYNIWYVLISCLC